MRKKVSQNLIKSEISGYGLGEVPYVPLGTAGRVYAFSCLTPAHGLCPYYIGEYFLC